MITKKLRKNLMNRIRLVTFAVLKIDLILMASSAPIKLAVETLPINK